MAQTSKLIGAWHWSDKVNSTSIFFDADGQISKQTTKNGTALLPDKFKKGTYQLNDSLLIITWADKTKEKIKLNFINENSFRAAPFPIGKGKRRSEFVFNRVIDEEVKEDEN